MTAADRRVPPNALVVLNPRSGGGKTARFHLRELAESLGARIGVTDAEHDAASLARVAVAEGTEVLAVAGGDGTVSAVAAVAADAGLPLVVVPAGTRNHFARDLGLDLRNPASALDALRDGDPERVDLGLIGGRVFINNVSFGAYADALFEPGYREAKLRTFASIAPDYVSGQQGVEARVDTPEGTIEFPQVLLVSNNPYHIATPQYLGRRFALNTGSLGGIVLKRPPDPPPDLLQHLRTKLRQAAGTGHPTPVISWSAPTITAYGTASGLPAAIDGEPVILPLPARCEIRPGALRLVLPAHRPGIPREPKLPQRRF
ncbi:diacylglycerol/lipid kinase family protein [Amycolatopsis pigmentata]|uniref:Diacylglycerol/lipid kinase family protein n=1 Tax=Amycolatopsis pigmentata TaxID=450801 RepID=A0ABW5G5M7_9PSEU